MKISKILIVICLVALVFGMVGCKPEKKEAGKQTIGQKQAAQNQGQQNTGGGNTGSDGGSDFISFAKASQAATFKVTYDFESSGGQKISGTFVNAQKGDKKKIETTTTFGSGLIYYLDKIYSCTDAQGKMSCFAISENDAQEDQAAAMAEEAGNNPDGFTITKANVVTIAGAAAQCFIIESTTEDATVNICYESNGVPLYMKFESSSSGQVFSSTMTATSYSTSVSDSEFNLPAEPIDIAAQIGGNLPEGVDISDFI